MSIAKIRIAAKAALVTAALTVATVSAQADTPYVFVAIDTTRHGADVVNGRYEEAIAGIRKDGESNFTYGESTNLCIAYTKSGDTVSALESCDRAVDIARTVAVLSSHVVSRHTSGQILTVAGGMEGRALWSPEQIDEDAVRRRLQED